MASRNSVVSCLGYCRSRCGYCEGKNSSHNFGMWGNSVSVEDYQVMIDAGWRRSGHYLYRPDIAQSCCPAYTIRLRANSFTPSTSQKRVLKRLRKYSRTDTHDSHERTDLHCANTQGSRGKKHSRDSPEDVGADVTPGTGSDAAPGRSSGSLKKSCSDENPDTPLSIVQQTAQKQYESETSRQSSSASQVSGILRTDVLAAVLEALRELASSKSGEPAVSEQLVAAAAPFITVSVPRKWKTKKSRKKLRANSVDQGRKISENRSGDGEGIISPHFSSNVALVLAAAARRLAMESGAKVDSAAVEPVSNAGEKHGTKSNHIALQMDFGRIILKTLQDRCSLNDPIFANIELASPGFINIWIHERKELPSNSYWLFKNLAARRSSPSSAPSEDVRQSQKNLYLMPTASGTHQSEDSSIPTPSAASRFSPGPFTMDIVPARFDDESFQVYCRYQTTVHRDDLEDCSKESYMRFLVKSPLVPVPGKDDSDVGYGSFHILYKLMGRLFAVGVVDILPQCLSSVYLFYDPDFAVLSPGVLSALKEIEWVQKESERKPDLQFYYMGYYIHSCPKMRYKASYAPSEIMCPETRAWTPAAVAIERLNSMGNNVTRLAPVDIEPGTDIDDYTISHESALEEARSAVLRLSRHNRMTLSALQRQIGNAGEITLRELREVIARFVKLTGRTQSRSFVFDIEPHLAN